LNFFVATSAVRLLTAKLKDFAFPSPEMQSSHVVPLASAPAGCAVPYSTTRDHCGALKVFVARIVKLASYPVFKMGDDYSG
jgi:hypothetical protein